MISKPFGELAVGDRTVSRGRTITETDVVHFCMLTGNWLGLHCDAEFAKHTQFGQRIVQGSLILSIANTLLPFNQEVVEAFHGVDRLRFLKPTFIGDTLCAHSELIRVEAGSKGGLATALLSAVNQREEAVMSCEFTLRVRAERLASGGQ